MYWFLCLSFRKYKLVSLFVSVMIFSSFDFVGANELSFRFGESKFCPVVFGARIEFDGRDWFGSVE